MDKTIQIFRGLLNLRNCNRVFTSKYCTSRKDNYSEIWQKLSTQKDKGPENEIKKENIKLEDKVNSPVENKGAAFSKITKIVNSKNVDKKLGTEAHPDQSSGENFSSENEKLLEKKLNKLIYTSVIDKSSNGDSNVDFNLKSELKSYTKNFETSEEDAEISKVGVSVPNDSFTSLLRRSAFIDLGDPVNKLVVGEIYLTVNDDLYIDFGWKFPAVCPKPKINPDIYNIGAKVLLRIKDLELNARFLGEKEYTSLLEADCDIIYRINDDGTKFVKSKWEKKP